MSTRAAVLKNHLIEVGVVSVALLFLLFGAVITVKASSDTCFDIKGQGMEILKGGVANSGVTDFEAIAGNPLFQYEACVEDDGLGYPEIANPDFGSPGTSPYYHVKGWAWNDNLGWISFYCDATGLNLGSSCGGFEYGVTIDDAGGFHGYAWGDNVGWISFNTPAKHQVMLETDLPECQGYIYGPLTKPYAVCPNHTKADTMAWSDNVGWIDFDGVIIPWYTLVEALTDAEIIVELLPDSPSSYFKTAAPNPPLANNSDAYTLRVTITDKDGNPVVAPRYDIGIEPNWAKDTVKKDQTDPTKTLGTLLDSCTADANRAVTKKCGLFDPSNYTVDGIWEADVTSLAPTSNMNVLMGAGEVEKFPYEEFLLPAGFLSSPLESNDLTLNTVDIYVYDNDASICAYGDDVDLCNPIARKANDVSPHLFKFLPQTEVDLLGDPNPAHEDYIDISVGIPLNFKIRGYSASGASVTLNVGIDPGVIGLKFVFDMADEIGILDLVNDPQSRSVTLLLDGSINPHNISAGIAQDPDNPVEQIISGLYMYTEVVEPNGVKYFSNKLPRVTGATAILPIAVLRGAVYSTGAVTTTQSVDVIRSMGDISTNVLRDTIFRNVSSIIAGVAQPGVGYTTIKSDLLNGGFRMTSAGTPKELLLDSGGAPSVYYARGEVHIGESPGNTTVWKGERTIIVIGGNVHIDENLYNAPGASRPKLGIIVLKDLSASAADMKKQGHVYIHEDVNNIQANIFADGSLFTYDGAGFDADGVPAYADAQAYEDSSKTHQLHIEGSIASQNTIGGATRSPMIDGFGQETNDLLRARQYDLNFLRMYVGMIKRDPTTGNAVDFGNNIIASDSDLRVIHPVSKIPWSVHDNIPPRGHVWPPNEVEPGVFFPALGLDSLLDLGSTYVFYDPPSPTLPGFAVSGAVDITVRPQ